MNDWKTEDEWLEDQGWTNEWLEEFIDFKIAIVN